MKTTIKIDRKSIKRNPSAGRTQSNILGAIETRFKTKCTYLELQSLLASKGIIVTKQDHPQNESVLISVSGFIDDPDYDFTKLPGKWEIESNRNIQTVNHLPESTWLYKYVPTKVKCENCKRSSFVSELETDCNDDGCWTVCPNCNGAETFDFEMEDIYTVVKEMKL